MAIEFADELEREATTVGPEVDEGRPVDEEDELDRRIEAARQQRLNTNALFAAVFGREMKL